MLSVERCSPLGDIEVLGVDLRDAHEHRSGLGHVAGTLVEITQGVRTSKVMLLWLSWHAEASRKQSYGPRKISLVSAGASGHDASLGHESSAGRRLTQLLPQAFDLAVLPQSALTVCEHRVLLRAPTTQLDERGQLARSVLPPTEPIQREAVQLAYLGQVRHLSSDRSKDLPRITEPLSGESRRRVAKSSFESLGTSGSDQVDQLRSVDLDALRFRLRPCRSTTGSP